MHSAAPALSPTPLSSSSFASSASSSSASSSRLSASPGAVVPSSSSSSSFRLVQRDLARLFSVRVSTYSPVRMNRLDPLIAVLRIGLQCWIECTRSMHLQSAAQLHQQEADLHVLQQLCIPQPIMAEQGGEEGRIVWAQMEEVRHSLMERCSERIADLTPPLTQSQLDRIVAHSAQQLRTEAEGEAAC